MKFSTRIFLAALLYGLFVLTFILYTFAEKHIDTAYDDRIEILTIIRDIRHSLDCSVDLTFYYVTTQNTKYSQFLKDGRFSNEDFNNCVGDVSIDSYIDKLIKLTKLQNDTSVFNKIKIEYDSLLKSEARIADMSTTDMTQALSAIYNPEYLEPKYSILRSLHNLTKITDSYSIYNINISKINASYYRWGCGIFGLLIILTSWYVYHGVHKIIGTSLDSLHSWITKSKSKATKVNVISWIRNANSKLSDLDLKQAKVETRLARLDKLYDVIERCNNAIIQCTESQDLFDTICKDAVKYGDMKMAWIGLLQDDSYIKPIASYGIGLNYLEDIKITIDESVPEGQGPTGISMRDDTPFWNNDYESNPLMEPWKEKGKKYGWKSSCSLPLHCKGKVVGAFTMYSASKNAFDEMAQNLLTEMALSIDHAILKFDQQTEIERSFSLLRTVLDTVPIRVFWKDLNSTYLGCNLLFAKDAGLDDPNQMIGKKDTDLAWKEYADDYISDDYAVIRSGESKLYYEESLTNSKEESIRIRISKVPLKLLNNIIGLLGVYEDITQMRETEERLQFLANYDQLTGLPNRNQLDERLKYALSIAKRSSGNLALMFMDIDHFKNINDTLGHNQGDDVLKIIANRLVRLLREEDTVTRLSGDEFVILLPGIDYNGAAMVAQKVQNCVSEPIIINNEKIIMTASIGIAFYPDDGEDLNTLSKSADAAMYRAKRNGRHSYCFFTREMQKASMHIMNLSTALYYAIELNQFSVVYQAQTTVDGRLCGAEALIRWFHPDYGNIPPDEFIKIAEDNGTIFKIGKWVLEQSLEVAKQVQITHSNFRIAVNLSISQFTTDLLDTINTSLSTCDYDPNLLELELTESVAMKDPEYAIEILNILHSRGIRISIDDFGTGYSSLSYLKKFKIDKLKIDKSFIGDCCINADDRAIVDSIIRLSKSMNISTIAEGVESIDQLEYLRSVGCDKIQGYLLSKPLPKDEFLNFLAQFSTDGMNTTIFK